MAVTVFVKLLEEYPLTHCFSGCPGDVEENKVYKARKTMENGNPLYVLEGIEGRFFATSFKEIPVFRAITGQLPKKGQSMQGFLVQKEDGQWQEINYSSTVQAVTQEDGENHYRVQTMNTIYLVNVI